MKSKGLITGVMIGGF
jgi:hypothetical protein